MADIQSATGERRMNEVVNNANIDIMDKLKKTDNIFVSEYKLYLQTDKESCEEIETQKAIFYLQQKEAEDEAGGESDV